MPFVHTISTGVPLNPLPDVSVAFPSVALSYVLVALLGNLWFGEAVTAPHIGGIVLIVIGVGLLHAF